MTGKWFINLLIKSCIDHGLTSPELTSHNELTNHRLRNTLILHQIDEDQLYPINTNR